MTNPDVSAMFMANRYSVLFDWSSRYRQGLSNVRGLGLHWQSQWQRDPGEIWRDPEIDPAAVDY